VVFDFDRMEIKKMLRQFFVAAVLATACQSALGADNILRLAPGESKTIALKENPSTGYVWRVDREASSNLDILRIADSGFSRPESGPPIGQPGVHRWTISAISKGRARIEFIYERPWEHRPVKRERWIVVAQ
jgi:inhibitor of cysteine peptidase